MAPKLGQLLGVTSGVFVPGTPLHCAGILDKRVGTVLSRLDALTARDHLRVWWYVGDVGPHFETAMTRTPPLRQYVILGSYAEQQGEIVLQTDPTPITPRGGSYSGLWRWYTHEAQWGCR
ncbi:MAG TPA: hypothetical protein VMD59_01995 [Acidimicrobiales bacterium]|nr:hypothetical protein [Acidimicrobiales bacterium]